MTDRTILAITGADRASFLDTLVTNRVPATGDGLRYAALLTPQGKLIADFFLLAEAECLLLDVPAERAPVLYQRLSLYRLRAKVGIDETRLTVRSGTGPMPDGALADPRHPALGWRLYGAETGAETGGEAGDGAAGDGADRNALRVEHVVPAWGGELTEDAYPLEMGFERLHGVDFGKGCYVGQEVTARMKHKTELRKGLGRVTLSGPAAPGDEITSGGRPVGTLGTISGNRALALLRYDRATGPLSVGSAEAHMDYPQRSSGPGETT